MADTENTAPATETTQEGQSEGPAGKNTQDEALARLKDYETKIAQLVDLDKKLKDSERETQTQKAEAARWQASYKAYQANTTASLQDAARMRKQLEEQSRVQEELAATRAQVTALGENLAFILSKVSDEDAAKEFTLRQREANLRQMEEAARLRTQAPVLQPTQDYQGYVDPDIQKRQFLEFYFPNSGIDHNSSAIDWAPDAQSTQDAFRRFTTSVQKLMMEQRSQPQNQEPAVQSEAETLLAQLRKEREELEASRATAAAELKETARKEVESRLRATGADSGNSSQTASSARVATQLNEVDERQLYTGDTRAARQRAANNMEAELKVLRDQYLSQNQ